ncbi:leucine carboxyl methyltransferase [Penicillium argentinense]|uniref:tRNA wybutosine-synthesizing protein 4 n=1 Tax=Penicillium argentinense TaxID=1131581 RepID=A0A9W9FE25_9EURO|nr:leucine carboxyl methyltransferase [Penicillium argentinense]KAJ5098426.1 leucine carboxyl methyltransferase [Penicillium argentinense]
MAPSKRSARSSAAQAEKAEKTNNSSIASKRSVEMIYHQKPHFFQHFVPKTPRRSPIINRGYWLRMYAMAETVRQFMEKEPIDKPKYVLNLGCGYDPLPFMLLSDEKKSGRRGQTVFVDIDYEKLMVRKKNAIRAAKEISAVLEEVQFGEDQDPIQIRSPRYIAVGCDLKNLKKLDDVLHSTILPSTDCSVLFLAEVSLTYMDVESANDVVTWASKLTNDAQFCILEQFFPDGPGHPFAKTMMSHFNKWRAPLFSIHKFPSLAEQEQRFRNAGWPQARARCLWDLWSDDEFLPASIRTGLDSFEAFDEWEEFALFASHYFVLVASNTPPTPEAHITTGTDKHTSGDISSQFVVTPNCPLAKHGRRRYGALVPDSSCNHLVGYHGGQGEQSRLSSSDLYTNTEAAAEPDSTPLSNNIPARHPLPNPSPTVGATDVRCEDESSSILVYGGKTQDNKILDSWLVWSYKEEAGWQPVKTIGSSPEARFGASIARIADTSGILFGGIGANGTILEDIWAWDLTRCDDGFLQIELIDVTRCIHNATPQLFPFMNRFGATVNATSYGLVLAGGIIPRQIVPVDKEILLLDPRQLLKASAEKQCDPSVVSAIGLGQSFNGPRPLLTGHVACTIGTDQVLLLGGGAVCYAFGNFWTEGTWLLQPQPSATENEWGMLS